MDGLLIDSEDKYTICTNEVLRKYGKPELPWHIKAQLQGRPGPPAGKIFSESAQLPVPREQYLEEVKKLQQKHFPETKTTGRNKRAADYTEEKGGAEGGDDARDE